MLMNRMILEQNPRDLETTSKKIKMHQKSMVKPIINKRIKKNQESLEIPFREKIKMVVRKCLVKDQPGNSETLIKYLT